MASCVGLTTKRMHTHVGRVISVCGGKVMKLNSIAKQICMGFDLTYDL